MRPYIILGGGGHARVLIETLKLNEKQVIGFTDCNESISLSGIPWIGYDEVINNYNPAEVLLVNGLGSLGNNSKRKNLYEFWKQKGYSFATIIHPSAILAKAVILEEGVQIMAGAVIQTGSHIGQNTIINTRATIDHDAMIHRNVHIAPGTVLSGNVTVEEDAHVGTGAVVIQGITIGQGSIVGAGAVVVRNVQKYEKVVGVPARKIETMQHEKG